MDYWPYATSATNATQWLKWQKGRAKRARADPIDPRGRGLSYRISPRSDQEIAVQISEVLIKEKSSPIVWHILAAVVWPRPETNHWIIFLLWTVMSQMKNIKRKISKWTMKCSYDCHINSLFIVQRLNTVRNVCVRVFESVIAAYRNSSFSNRQWILRWISKLFERWRERKWRFPSEKNHSGIFRFSKFHSYSSHNYPSFRHSYIINTLRYTESSTHYSDAVKMYSFTSCIFRASWSKAARVS